MSAPRTASFPKNHFRCFECKKIHPQRDGMWRDWQSMQVHLCSACDRSTLQRPERARKEF